MDAMTPDPYLWLEDVTGDDALAWVRARNDRTLADLATGERFDALRDEVREVLDTDARIAYPNPRGEFLYNFWRDAEHPRGVWRRTGRAEYEREQPVWDVLFDVDAVAAAEDENWVWKSAAVLRPSQDRVLISLSRGGADATVVREYSLTDRDWVTDGFAVEEAKTDISWVDADTVFVGTDLGEGSLTASGYPRTVRRWRRGQSLTDATEVFAGEYDDVAVSAHHDRTPGFERDVASRATDFWNSEVSLLTAAGPVRIDAPTDADVTLWREWLLIRPATPWQCDGTDHPAGALLAARLDDFLAGDRLLHTVFDPDDRSALHQLVRTENHLLLVVLRDVESEVLVATPDAQGFHVEPAPGLPQLTDLQIVGADPLSVAEGGSGDEWWLTSSGYLTPATLLRGTVGAAPVAVKQAPAFFDAAGLAVNKFHAVSDDGTAVPYTVIGPRTGGPGPTLLYGYGGFEVSLTPAYSGGRGRAWLARGGTYVVANLRGGGELGPGWHTQAVREGRHLVGEDFAAVARDLVARGITTRDQLGAQGGSNGGLLMGIMLTSYPELFGALVCQVPLLDMRRFHLLLAGASWMAEYGDPDDPADWEFISRYSPYQLVDADREYPPALVMTSTRDDRVHPGHARKMVARLEETGHDVTYYENIEGGHGGAADNAQLAFSTALAHEFLWRRLTR